MAKFDRFTAAFGEAINDIRNRFEESWFGRAVTPDNPATNPGDHRLSFAEQLGWDRSSGHDGTDRKHGHGIDH